MKLFSKFLALSFAVVAFSFASVNAQSFTGGDAKLTRTLEQQIFKKLVSLPNYGVFDHIAYQVNGSTVILSGKVFSLGTRSQAARVVRDIPGIEQVVNNIEDLPPSPSDNRIRMQVLREFSNAAGIGPFIREPRPSVRIIVDRGHVTLEGYVNNRGTSNTMYILANGVPGVFSVTNHLLIEKEIGR